MFSPADVELIAGAPSVRRRFLDIVLALTARGYLDALQRYRAALARRNAALRDAARAARQSTASVAVWEPPLAEHGARARARAARVGRDEWSDAFERLCDEIGEPARVSRALLEHARPTRRRCASRHSPRRWRRSAPVDMRRGLTHAGPHRDDLVTLTARRHATCARSARRDSSERAAIALRMLEAATFTRAHGTRARCFCSTIRSPSSTRDARREFSALLARDRTRPDILAVPRESDIPARAHASSSDCALSAARSHSSRV